jgi:hypothetical protein
MKNTFENAQAGDRVWSIRRGWGVITHVSTNRICVKFENLDWDYIFTACGKDSAKDLNPTLFWDEVKFDIPQKPIKMKLIHGVEVPDITFKPTSDDHFYYPSVDSMSLHKFMTYNDGAWCKFLSENSLCYPCDKIGRAAAILHTKAMLAVKE